MHSPVLKRYFSLMILTVLALNSSEAIAQERVEVFSNAAVNFTGIKSENPEIEVLQDGRILLKKIQTPSFPEGTDVKVKVTLKSAGDKWDKSGSLFIIPNPEKIDFTDIAKGNSVYPSGAGIEGYPGIKLGDNYEPALEVLRFMTPFGVGHYSDEEKYPEIAYNRPVYIPNWSREVVWEQDVSQLAKELTGEVIIGVWIDTWTKEGYEISVELLYSGRPLTSPSVKPLVNTVYYAGQKHPDLFAFNPLEASFELPKKVKNAKLYYITTGHGGHSGGDEFIKLKNRVAFNGQTVLDTIPWRDDCAAFRRFNPSSGVWTRKDTARAYNDKREKVLVEVTERLASSDLSRSNWCPGSDVAPYVMALGDLEKGRHKLLIDIDATPIEGEKLNHWLVSAYLTYDE